MLKLSADAGGLGGRVGSLDTILKEDLLRATAKLAKQFQRRRFLNIFQIGSYVKTMSTDSAVLVGGRGLQIQF